MTLGLCMIVKNEEEVLARCLDSVQGLTDEIVIVDTGSQDATIQTAKRYTDLVYPYRWNFDFASAELRIFSRFGRLYPLAGRGRCIARKGQKRAPRPEKEAGRERERLFSALRRRIR